MTDLLCRLNIYDEQYVINDNFDDVDFSNVDNLLRFHLEIQKNTDKFLIQLYANIWMFMKNPININEMYSGDFFTTFYRSMSDAIKTHFHIEQIKNILYFAGNLFANSTIDNLISTFILKNNLYYDEFISMTKNKTMLFQTHPLFPVCKYYAQFSINQIQTSKFNLKQWIYDINHSIFSSFTQPMLDEYQISIVETMNLSEMIANKNNIEYLPELKKILDKSKSLFNSFRTEIQLLFAQIKIENVDDIDAKHVFTFMHFGELVKLPTDKIDNNNTNNIYFYKYVLKHGYDPIHHALYILVFMHFCDYIVDNWELYETHMNIIDDVIEKIGNVSETLKKKIFDYKEAIKFNHEFHNMNLTIDPLEPFSKEISINRSICNFNVTHADVEQCNVVPLFVPELEYYVRTVCAFCKKKFLNINYAIMFGTSVATIKINNKTVTGNLLAINVFLAINTCANPTIDVLKRLLGHTLFLNELTKLVEQNYIKYDDNVFSFKHLTENTVIKDTLYQDTETSQNDVQSMIMCYIVKVMKKNSTSKLSIDAILEKLCEYNIEELCNIEKSALQLHLTQLTNRGYIACKKSMYYYVL